MSIFKKILWILYGLVLIATLAVFYLSTYHFGYETVYGTLNYFVRSANGFYVISALTGISALGGMILLLLGIFKRRTGRNLEINYRDGSVFVTQEAMINNIRHTLSQFPVIRNSDIRTRVRQGKNPSVNVKIDSEIYVDTDLNALGDRVKQQVQSELGNLVGVPVSDVAVTFHKMNPETRSRVV